MKTQNQPTFPTGNTMQLILATGAFAICFSVFGSLSAMMPIIKKNMNLNAMQVSIAIAAPVLLGSVGRIPLGILTDKYGGKRIFILAMTASIIPAFLIGFASNFIQIIVAGFFIGISLAVFSIGVGFINAWYPSEKQGTVLGIYGTGNIGQSIAAFGAPVFAGLMGIQWGFWVFGVLLIAWLLLFILKAQDSPFHPHPKTIREMIYPLKDSGSWRLSLYYFLTFGGFVAMAMYLPTFLTEIFNLTPYDAGFRTAGFIVLATAMRPVGGILSDRINAHSILLIIFPVIALMASLMAFPLISTFTLGALGMAAAIGLGNGAVFKLVPDYFPQSVGTVTGLVGAAGGLGGFFPPLVLGILKQFTGSYAPGFILLALFSLYCFISTIKTKAGKFQFINVKKI